MLSSNKYFCCLRTIIRRYKNTQMLIPFQALNNNIAYKIFYACYRILSNSFRHQTIGNYNKLIEQDSKENATKISTPIFLVIKIHIKTTRILEDGVATANYNLKGRLCKSFECLN